MTEWKLRLDWGTMWQDICWGGHLPANGTISGPFRELPNSTPKCLGDRCGG